ncbi:hypothetical protein [Chromobacterium phragmitis]|uniref:Uncharacterized protein n=1 Tax=Chromobacterium phragmitis TaxID=2202141 RepID=A0ABV0IZH8_9NEIS
MCGNADTRTPTAAKTGSPGDGDPMGNDRQAEAHEASPQPDFALSCCDAGAFSAPMAEQSRPAAITAHA